MAGRNFDRVSPGILVFGGKFLQSFCLEHKDTRARLRNQEDKEDDVYGEQEFLARKVVKRHRAAAQEQANLSGKEGRRGKGN